MGWLSRRSVETKGDLDYRTLVRLGLGDSATPDPEYPATNFMSHVANGYDRNELVFACIVEKATSTPEAPLRVYPTIRQSEPIENHRLRRLIAQPNPLITEFELFEITVMHLDLAGNAFWEIVRDRSGQVVELWPLRPDRIRMKRQGRQVAYGYIVEDSRLVDVEVVHFRYPNPVDPLVGTPPMRAALRATALDNNTTDFVKTLLQNQAMPAVAITLGDLDTVLDEATTTRLRTKWMESYGGRNQGKPVFLQTGMDVKALGLNLSDLEFPDMRTVAEARICMAFGVPPIIVGAKVGLDRSTFSNYGEAKKSFWEETLMPLQRRMRDTITTQLLPKVAPSGPGVPRVELRFDHSLVPALSESEQAKFERGVRAVSAGILTVNEGRSILGYDNVTGGEVLLMPSGVIATRDPSEPRSAPVAPSIAPASELPAEDDSQQGKAWLLERKSSGVLDEATRAHIVAFRNFYSGKRDAARGVIGGGSGGLDGPAWSKELARDLYEVALAYSGKAGAEAWADYDAAATENYQWRRSERTAGDVIAKLLEAIDQALLDEDPEEAMDDEFDVLEGSTAEQQGQTMATETVAWGAVEAGRQALSRGDASKATKTWVVTSGNPRASHAAMNGETVGLDQDFSNGLPWPGALGGDADETAGCTCALDINID
ncbi:phage portal protein [Naumannella sp. ID2617S]|nr:phage portal protein [Naumannella sp. ID2617S]